MAPASPSKAKARRDNGAQFFNHGVQGRKTGITLPERERDEHGIEDLDGLFSSPEKPTRKQPKLNGNGNDSVTLGSADMEIAESTILEPLTAVSAARKLRSTKTTFPPPSGRSPVKTNIGSSPRRQSSVAPVSQGNALSASAPDKFSTRPVARQLDFTADDPQPSIENTPEGSASSKTRSRINLEPPTDVFDLPPTPKLNGTKKSETKQRQAVSVGQQNGAKNVFKLSRKRDDIVNMNSDDVFFPTSVEELPGSDKLEPQLQSSPTAVKPNGIVAKSGASKLKRVQAQNKKADPAEINSSPPVEKPKRGRGRPRKDKTQTNQALNPSTKRKADEDVVKAEQPVKRRGRPPKNRVSDNSSIMVLVPTNSTPRVAEASVDEASISIEENAGDKDALPTGKSRRSKDAVAMPPPPVPRRRGRPPASSKASKLRNVVSATDEEHDESVPSQRANSAVNETAPKRASRERSVQIPDRSKSVVSKSGGQPTYHRTLQILKEHNPSQEQPTVTRSGRTCLRPMDYWARERCQFAKDGTILKVVRAETLEDEDAPIRKRRLNKSKRGPKPQRFQSLDAIDEEDGIPDLPSIEMEELEDWEMEEGILTSILKAYDPERDVTIEDSAQDFDDDVAYASRSIITRETPGADFRFTKVFSLPFFSTGVIEIPPNGYKGQKNSKKMHSIFYVVQGKVHVEINGFQFAICSGGTFQVPRGNIYAFENRGNKEVRLFFAQASEPY